MTHSGGCRKKRLKYPFEPAGSTTPLQAYGPTLEVYQENASEIKGYALTDASGVLPQHQLSFISACLPRKESTKATMCTNVVVNIMTQPL